MFVRIICMIVHLLLLLASVTNVVTSSEENSCSDYKSEEYFGANCSRKSLTEVPQSLKPNIEFLDLSWNFLEDLNHNSFTKYRSLLKLNLSMNRIPKLDVNAFTPLTKLLTLDMSSSFQATTNTFPYLPASLKRLYLDDNYNYFENKRRFKFPELKSLEFLSLRNNEMKVFPDLIEIGPSLIELDLRNNSISTFDPEKLAPLCQLKKLRLSPNKLLFSETEGCQCLMVKALLNDYGIELNDFSCRNGNKKECNLTPTESIKEKRSKCLSQAKLNKLFNKYTVIGALAVIILLMLALCTWCKCRRTKTRNAALAKNSYEVNRYDEQTIQTDV